VFAEGWEKLGRELDIPAAIQAVGPGWSDAMPALVDHLATEPTTMCHGDWRADNLLFEPDGSVVALDFQLIATARGTYDLAYFVTQSLDRPVAAEHERALFDRWKDAVEAAGAPPEDNATAWDDYRKAALFCLVYPVVAWRGMDAGDPRQVGLATTMLDRFARAVEDLDLADLL
jgi:aminoglycoside/choline kinase family phosphotransferase